MSSYEMDIPALAFRFVSSIDLEGSEADPTSVPIRMVARSSKPIEQHWFFGKIAHDMAGLKRHKDRLPVDYAHEEVIGYLDRFDVDDQHNLVVEGKLIKTSAPDDRARQVSELAAGGVPFEASIDW